MKLATTTNTAATSEMGTKKMNNDKRRTRRMTSSRARGDERGKEEKRVVASCKWREGSRRTLQQKKGDWKGTLSTIKSF